MDVDPPPDLANAPLDGEEWPLGHQAALHTGKPVPSWLTKPPPKKSPFNWPRGAKSPSWFDKIATCARMHAQRYRYKKLDPTGLDGAVGNVVHGALEDATNLRLFPGTRGPIPPTVSPDELLFLLELQQEAVRQDLEILPGEGIVTAEVLARAREIVANLPPLELKNLWKDRKGNGGAEYVWNFQAGSSLVVAGVLDLIQVQPHPTNMQAPPLDVLITDYKTGRSQIPDPDELRKNPQAVLTLCWAKRAFSSTPRIRFRVWNLTLNESATIEWTQGIDDLMVSFVRSANGVWARQEEHATTGTHCARCPYRADCGPYAKYLRDAVHAPPTSLENQSMPRLLEIQRTSKILEKLAEKRRQDADKLILAAMGDQKKYVAGPLKALKKSRETVRVEDTASLVLELAEQTGTPLEAAINMLCSFKKDGIEDFCRALPIEKQKLARSLVEQRQTVGRTRPWIEVHEHEPVF